MSDYIPDELLVEILARLPVASLLRFQSVCKSWYSLITNPGFVTKHLIQSITNGKRNGDKLLVRLYDIINKERYLLLNDDDKFGGKYLEFEFPFKIPFGYFRVVGSCNGLLCVAGDFLTDKAQIMIWNPSTRKSVTLPMAPKPQGPHMCVYGFGSHPTTHEYEVIRIQYEIIEIGEYELKLPPKVEIYTQGTRSWRGISSAVPSYRIVNYMWCQAFVDGAVHWVACETCVGGGVRNLIMLFNMASETFCEFKLPPTLAYQPPPSLSIKTFGQSLAVLCSGPRDAGGCCIWVMKEYGVAESWTKLFSSNLLGMPNKTLGFRRNGEILLASDNSLASYAPGTNTLATTGIRGSSRAFYVDPFMQTLVLV